MSVRLLLILYLASLESDKSNCALQANAVIEILGVFRINGHDLVAAAIHTAGQFCRFSSTIVMCFSRLS